MGQAEVLIFLWRRILFCSTIAFMTAAYRVVVAEREDIATVTVVCEKCGSEVSLIAETAVVPVACPSCGREYGKTITEALVAFARFHRFAKGAEELSAKPLFRFNIKQVGTKDMR